ncbi:hypothetical protein GGX14DRAFT_359065 [Mycena pura]|uniref:Histone-lysine N-methyltransferase, H3 lysine-4 specific n=1 Tax=Mycena pura TaxID=153505 RepID=A0AAD6YFC9_9AGAR|nr:hypothetical protein GGX14DRAFT_359065 [Mycena pura]
MIEHVRARSSPEQVTERIRGKGKGREILYRMEGEVMDGADERELCEEEVVVCDPRKVPGFRHPPPLRYPRTDYALVTYEHDANSPTSPPTTVLITGYPPLTPNPLLQRHLTTFGTVANFHRQMDSTTGATLGVVAVRFATPDEARRCMEREDGARGPIAGAPGGAGAGEERRAVMDPEGLVLKALLKEMEERRKREREEKRRREREKMEKESEKEKEEKQKDGSGERATPAETPKQASTTATPAHNNHLPARPAHPSLPPNPLLAAAASASQAVHEARIRHPNRGGPRGGGPMSGANAVGAGAGARGGWTSRRPWLPRRPANSYRPGEPNSRSPSPTRDLLEAARAQLDARDKGRERGHDLLRAQADVQAELARNGREHLRIKVEHVGAVRDDDVWAFCNGFEVEKVLRDHLFIYVTFKTPGTARRAERVLSGRNLGFHTVTLSWHTAPGTATRGLDDAEIIERAQELVYKELRELLEKDIADRIVSMHLRQLIQQHRSTKGGAAAQEEVRPAAVVKRDWKSLSFKKARREVEVEVLQEVREEPDEEQVVLERQKKRRKKEPAKKVKKIAEEDIESEDTDTLVGRKRPASEDRDAEEPPRKKSKSEEAVVVKKGAKKKKAEKKHKLSVDEVVLPDEYEPPIVADLRLSPEPESSLSPSRSPSPTSELPARPPTPLPNVFDEAICEDDEDVYYAKLVLSGVDIEPTLDPLPLAPPESAPFFRKHITGSGRTEGFYKITHAEKVAYVTQYQARTTNVEATAPVDEPPPQHVESSRSNRATARRRAQGLEEINQVQRAIALSKGEMSANELSFKFNQLQTRKKHLRFARSPIHDWGLYAMERISRGEMVIEYVGEIIRAQVAEKREKLYERQGIGSSYLFRIDEDLVVDATKKGNLGRLINHSCDPNCTAKIITINGEKKIVIYAKQEIELGDEITYDYHFPFEQDKIPCLCGSAKCRGFLN